VERRPYGVRPLHERVHQEDAALQGEGDNVLQGDPTTGFGSGPRQHGPHADARRHDGVRAHRRELDFGSAYNKTTLRRFNTPYFDPADLGIKMYPYLRGQMPITVTGAFNFPAGATKAT